MCDTHTHIQMLYQGCYSVESNLTHIMKISCKFCKIVRGKSRYFVPNCNLESVCQKGIILTFIWKDSNFSSVNLHNKFKIFDLKVAHGNQNYRYDIARCKCTRLYSNQSLVYKIATLVYIVENL